MARQGSFQHFATRPVEEYTRRELNKWTLNELKSEYSRLRIPVQERLKRFEGTEWTNTEQYRRNAGQYPVIRDVKTKEQAINLILKTKGFLDAKQSTISGLERARNKSISRLNERGFTFINNKNFRDFTDFMEEWRARNQDKIYDSDQVVELFDMSQELGIKPETLHKSFQEYRKIKMQKEILMEVRRKYMEDISRKKWTDAEIRREMKNARERIRYHKQNPKARYYK